MRKDYLLLLLVAVLLPGAAAVDPWFEDPCRSYLVDSPSDETGTDRIQGETCVQTFPYKGTQEQHETFCSSNFPFEFTMKRTDDQVTCIWDNLSAQCDRARKRHLTIRQINSKCYTTAECHLEGYELARPTSADEIRWIARLYRNQYEALIIDQCKTIKVMKDVGYTEGFIHKTKKENLMNVALIFSKLAIFGVYPGNAVREIPNAQRNATKLCMVPVLIDGNAHSVLSMPTTTRNVPSSTEQHKEQQQIGSGSAYTKFPLKIGGFHFGTAFITRNDYQPVFTTDGLVDIDHFHSQCARICHQCFAATYEIFLSYKNSMPYGRFWVPGQRKDASSSCGGAFDIQNRKHFRVKNNPGSHIPHIPANKNWFGGRKDSQTLPSYSCADQERMALQLIHTEQYITYVDVPAFDRLPIVCVSGQTVSELTSEGECEMRNRKFECKKGFQDALKVNELKMRTEQLGFHKNGQICVKPQSCEDVVVTTKQKFTSYLILVDGFVSIGWDNDKDNVAPFVYKHKNVIPQSALFILYQYGSGTAAKWAWRSKGWTSADFDSAYKEAIAGYLNSGTETYTNMNRLIDLSERYDEISKKYMIVITDGVTWDFSQAIADRRVKNQIKIVYITVGDSVDDYIRKTEGGNAFELYGVSNFGGLTVTQATKNMCDNWPEGHVEKIAYSDFLKVTHLIIIASFALSRTKKISGVLVISLCFIGIANGDICSVGSGTTTSGSVKLENVKISNNMVCLFSGTGSNFLFTVERYILKKPFECNSTNDLIECRCKCSKDDLLMIVRNTTQYNSSWIRVTDESKERIGQFEIKYWITLLGPLLFIFLTSVGLFIKSWQNPKLTGLKYWLRFALNFTYIFAATAVAYSTFLFIWGSRLQGEKKNLTLTVSNATLVTSMLVQTLAQLLQIQCKKDLSELHAKKQQEENKAILLNCVPTLFGAIGNFASIPYFGIGDEGAIFNACSAGLSVVIFLHSQIQLATPKYHRTDRRVSVLDWFYDAPLADAESLSDTEEIQYNLQSTQGDHQLHNLELSQIVDGREHIPLKELDKMGNGYTFIMSLNEMRKIVFLRFHGLDIWNMCDLIYLVVMSDGWKMVDICDKETPLYQTIDGLHCDGCKSPVSRHMSCTGAHVQSVRVLELGYEDRDMKQRMKELVSNWPSDDLLNVADNPHAPNSNLKAIYLKARAKTPLNGQNDI